jgi:hypothetical protein
LTYPSWYNDDLLAYFFVQYLGHVRMWEWVDVSRSCRICGVCRWVSRRVVYLQ